MYTPEDIQARLKERPFRPLRIVASEGLKFDIYHPDLVFVGAHDLMIGFPSPEHPTVYDRITRVAIIHIVALEELPLHAKPGDGQE
jgi:hypothetical protein